MLLRPGTLIDLAAITASHSLTNTAKSLGIPVPTLTAYVNARRFLHSSAVDHFGDLYIAYISKFTGYNGQKSSWAKSIYFTEAHEVEFRFRKIMEFDLYQHRFSCCAAQVLAEYEAATKGAEPRFSSHDAKSLLRLWLTNPKTDAELLEMQNLAFQYVLWRIKTREHFILEQFLPRLRAYEVRDQRPIPLLPEDRDPLFEPDHRLYNADNLKTWPMALPDVPRLKLPATLDVLLLCRKVGVVADQVPHAVTDGPVYRCFCESPISYKTIEFVAI